MLNHVTRIGFGDAKSQRGMTSTVMLAASPGLDPSRTRDLYGDVLKAAVTAWRIR
jgi:hypothetical protein